MKILYPLILSFLTFLTLSREMDVTQVEKVLQAAPQVKLSIPDENKIYTWNEQVRYSISVSDPTDGASKYDEIPSQECLLTIVYLPDGKEENVKKTTAEKEEKGLSLIRKSTCFGCHAHKTRMAGPSFQEIAKRYKVNENTIKNLSDHILNGSIGVWGNQQMPAHPDLTEEQCRQIANYILIMGDHPYRWIHPGLEGMFRIMDKPEIDRNGVYVLTASYTSTSGVEGKHSIVLNIR